MNKKNLFAPFTIKHRLVCMLLSLIFILISCAGEGYTIVPSYPLGKSAEYRMVMKMKTLEEYNEFTLIQRREVSEDSTSRFILDSSELIDVKIGNAFETVSVDESRLKEYQRLFSSASSGKTYLDLEGYPVQLNSSDQFQQLNPSAGSFLLPQEMKELILVPGRTRRIDFNKTKDLSGELTMRITLLDVLPKTMRLRIETTASMLIDGSIVKQLSTIQTVLDREHFWTISAEGDTRTIEEGKTLSEMNFTMEVVK
jgi:hypothetical protein